MNAYPFSIEEISILGIDPGLQKTGWAVIIYHAKNAIVSYQASGLLQTKAKDPLSVRLSVLSEGLAQVLHQYQPSQVAMETTFVNRNAQSSLHLSMARGALAASVGKKGVPLAFYSPTAIKAGLCGHGHADKQTVLEALGALFGDHVIQELADIKTMDPSDALAVAWYHAKQYIGSFVMPS